MKFFRLEIFNSTFVALPRKHLFSLIFQFRFQTQASQRQQLAALDCILRSLSRRHSEGKGRQQWRSESCESGWRSWLSGPAPCGPCASTAARLGPAGLQRRGRSRKIVALRWWEKLSLSYYWIPRFISMLMRVVFFWRRSESASSPNSSQVTQPRQVTWPSCRGALHDHRHASGAGNASPASRCLHLRANLRLASTTATGTTPLRARC